MDRSLRLWWWWLVSAAGMALLFGLAMVVFPVATERLFGGIYLSAPGGIAAFGADAANYVRFVTAVLGAVMAGWSAGIVAVLLGPFRAGDRSAWWLVAVPLVVWFVPDTAYSISAGFWQNAVLNVVALLVFAIPLAATFRSLGRGQS